MLISFLQYKNIHNISRIRMPTVRSKHQIRSTKTCDTLTIENSTDSEYEDSYQLIGISRKHRIRKVKPTRLVKKARRNQVQMIMESDSECSQQEIPTKPRLLKQIGMDVEEQQKNMIQQTETLRFRSYNNKINYRFFCYPDQILEMPSDVRDLRHIPEVDFDVQSDDEQIENSIKSMTESLREALQSEKCRLENEA